MANGRVTLEQVEQALRDLGGEAIWNDILNQVTKIRNGDYSFYLNYYNYKQTAFQVIQEHCFGYDKYRGPTHFEKIGKSRFRLVNSKPEFSQNSSHVITNQLTPIARDIKEPSQPERIKQETYRILRDTILAREVKEKYHYRCQICGQTIILKDEKLYAEAHHIKPLGMPHNGPDVRENILCVCPNHHVLLDYGAIKLDISFFNEIGQEFIDYHNEHIFGNQ